MTPGTDGEGAVRQWLHGFWEYYRRYTQTAVHAASAAALTAFGLLVFVDRLFVVLAITAYVLPPLFLYYFGANASLDAEETGHRVEDRGTSTGGTRPRGHDVIAADADDDTSADGRDGDADSRDADADGRDGDADSRDTDADGRDADADSRDADADDG